MTVPVTQLFDVKGQVAIVTGGSRGLGKEIARGFGEAGAKIVITARREQWLKPTAEEFRAAGFECLELVGDVADPEMAQLSRCPVCLLPNGGQKVSISTRLRLVSSPRA